ncbi:MAG: hypothetical protein JWN70_616 [Planctomycetaceae bacterium]|nr:hypothetical protein [Planctomycetaceae bacterium]
MVMAMQISVNDVARNAHEKMENELDKVWTLDLACPANLPLSKFKQHVLCLQRLMSTGTKSDESSFDPSEYWPPVSRELHSLRAECDALQLHVERCKPWVKIVVAKLMQRIRQCFQLYQIDEVETSNGLCPYPLHEECCRTFERVFHALADLPQIELWRPLESSKQNMGSNYLDQLTARTLAKVFDEYRDDSDQLTWGTLDRLRQECEQLLEWRRDHGDFLSWSPSHIREVRLLADRLGCDESGIPFEQEDTRAAFVRSIAEPVNRTWSIETDHQVRSWLKRILAWSDASLSRLDPSKRMAGVHVASDNLPLAVSPFNEHMTANREVGAPRGGTAMAANIGPQASSLLVETTEDEKALAPVDSGESQFASPIDVGEGIGRPRRVMRNAVQRKPRISKERANKRACSILRRDKKFACASAREWHRRIGCALGAVSNLPAWREIQDKKNGVSSTKSVRTRPMDPRLIDAFCVTDDEKLKALIEDQDLDMAEDERMQRTYERSSRS